MAFPAVDTWLHILLTSRPYLYCTSITDSLEKVGFREHR